MDTKLHTAVRYGNVNAVLEALQDGLDPNEIGLFKWSPVHEAANNGERDILKLLVSYKGDVNLRDKLHGNTPLHYAAREDNSACVTVLLKAGARIDIKNYEGMTCLDESTSLCREIIYKFVNSRNAGYDWTADKSDHLPKGNMSINGIQPHKDWDLSSVPEQAAIGELHLSFDYHKENLRIRVWQVSDLLLPPPQISMIESIFVRSYLIPDTAKKSNRHTEAVRVGSQESSSQPQNSIQHIFSPSLFRFESPLLYTGVTQDIVAERSIRLEVCMTQKHTHKTFLMAMVHLPLRTAVRHPIREKYPLIPCMNYTIPNNMRVYSAKDIIFGKSSSSLDQSLSRSSSVHSSVSCPPTIRDVHFDGVQMEKFLRRSSLYLTDSDCDDTEISSIDIKSSLDKSRMSSAGSLDVMSRSTDNEDTTDVYEPSRFPDQFQEHVSTDRRENPKPKKKIIPNELLDKVSISEISMIGAGKEDGEDLAVIKNSDNHVSSVVTTTEVPQKGEGLDLLSDAGQLNEAQASVANATSGRKKIMPPELFKLEITPGGFHGNQNVNQGKSEHLVTENGCVYDDIQRYDTNQSNAPEIQRQAQEAAPHQNGVDDNYKENEQNEDNGDDVTSEISHSLKPACLESPDTGPSSVPVSRPETPIWDFYDFTLEEGAADGENAEADTGSSKDGASSALGTLQESILRLSRASKVLDTCNVVGPVLPTVMIEDFEMDDDTNIVDDDEDDDAES